MYTIANNNSKKEVKTVTKGNTSIYTKSQILASAKKSKHLLFVHIKEATLKIWNLM